MKIALFGRGNMGRLVDDACRRRGWNVVCVRTRSVREGEVAGADVAIDFTEPAAVIGNVANAASARVPIVVGTTGWYDRLDEAKRVVGDAGTALVYGSNFSIGVNLTFELVEEAARLFGSVGQYDAFIDEAHHRRKKDAPSGTALTLKRIVDRVTGASTPVASLRAGYIPGTHTIGFDSEVDTVTITHTARGRGGFVEGALAAAEWVIGKQGVFEFPDVIRARLSTNGVRQGDR